ncbi:hypothetical protein B0J14DRAFT_682577 [Halenospora varia]|nr:hypothetical protein B0J14DRAFT_682577 [Halenospora varia]
MEGYAKVAHLMGQHNECAIFRRFSKLNMQNLLYLHAKLTYLEEDLKELQCKDQAEEGREMYSKDWWSLAQARHHDPEKTQWRKFLEIRKTLKEYNSQLSHLAYLSSFKGPKKYDLDFLRSWFERPKMGDFPLLGADRESWSPANTYDLIALQRRQSSDPFSHWLTNSFIPFFHNILGKRFKQPLPEDPESEICQYDEGCLGGVVNIIGTVVASLVPILSIVVLYFVTNILVRLGLTVAFTGAFSSLLALLSRARRVEIFAASSAFAAVQVVFIAGNNGYIP